MNDLLWCENNKTKKNIENRFLSQCFPCFHSFFIQTQPPETFRCNRIGWQRTIFKAIYIRHIPLQSRTHNLSIWNKWSRASNRSRNGIRYVSNQWFRSLLPFHLNFYFAYQNIQRNRLSMFFCSISTGLHFTNFESASACC